MPTLRPIRCFIAVPQTGATSAARAVFISPPRDALQAHRVVRHRMACHGELP